MQSKLLYLNKGHVTWQKKKKVLETAAELSAQAWGTF